MRIYVSGAITGLAPGVAREAFAEACRWLSAQGHDPLNPYDIPPWPGCACPGATDDQEPAGGKHEWGCYLRGDIAGMLGCDAIYLLPGWERSHGARLEMTVASAVGLRVLLATAEEQS